MRQYEIHYCYPNSPAAKQFGRTGFYVAQSWRIISPMAFDTVGECEAWCRKNSIPFAPHRFE